MAKLYIMGSANAIPGKERDNTYFFLENGNESVLIDSGLGVLNKFQARQLNIDSISDVIITHFHPDHVSSLPLLVMDWWLMGRKAPLTFHGLEYTLDRFRAMMSLYDWMKWPNFFPVVYHNISDDFQPLLQKENLTIYSTGVQHLIPTLGLRFCFNNQSIAYSCDTEPCEGVQKLALGTNILIHEATGKAVGHSTALDCGRAAARAEVDKLYLIHYPDDADPDQMIEDARGNFPGEIHLATDLMVFE